MIKSARIKLKQSGVMKGVRFIPLWYKKKPFRYRWKQLARAINLTYRRSMSDKVSDYVDKLILTK